MFRGIVLYLVVGFWYNVGSVEVAIITRDTYDLIQFPNCDGRTSNAAFKCDEVFLNTIPIGDNRTCTCKCEAGYVTYRDPYVRYNGSQYIPRPNLKPGCIWYSTYREGCHVLQSLTEETYQKKSKFPTPIILDITQSDEVTLYRRDFFSDVGCFEVVPYVQMPGKEEWIQVDVQFKLKRKPDLRKYYLLQWESNSSNIYAYQGLVMRLGFYPCGQPSAINCIMTKIAGTYTESKACKRRTTDGRCCVFPFVHQGKFYNDCATTDDMKGPWCAVSLNTAVTNGNHKWRENCDSFSPPIPSPASSTTKPSPTPRLQPTTTTSTSPRKPSPVPLTTKSTYAPPITTPIIPNERNGTQHLTDPPKATPVVMTVTITASPSCPSRAPPIASPMGADKGTDVGLIVGVVVGVLVLLAVFVVVIVCCRRRRGAEKRTVGKGVSNEVLAEEPSYASLNGTPLYTRKLTNHGFQESMEMSPELASVVRRRYDDAMNESQANHFYDTVAADKLAQLPSSVYNMPEADYSLIMTPSQQSKNRSRLHALNDDPSRHLYSVLERENDPLKNPEAIDNERAFVEANPLYGSTTGPDGDLQISPDLAGRVYEDPNELKLPRNDYKEQEIAV